MPKFEWSATLVMERQKDVSLIIEAPTIEEAKKKIDSLFLSRIGSTLWDSQMDKFQFLKLFPGVSLKHDMTDVDFKDSWSECKIYGLDRLQLQEEVTKTNA